MIDQVFYDPNAAKGWSGRIDGDNLEQRRWHQMIEPVNLAHLPKTGGKIVFLGFASDEGVKRNKGRAGAVKGPASIRQACSSLPFFGQQAFWDAGDIQCTAENLEEAQQQLGNAVETLLKAGAFPVLLGGGHEITYGHYKGIAQAYPEASIGIINIDAHFDLRKPDAAGSSSGTGFWQIAQRSENSFHYLALGIQKAANTQELFDRANALGAQYILDRFVTHAYASKLIEAIQYFAERVDFIYLTIDLDAFAAAYAPGVSAANPRGIVPDAIVETLFDALFETQKVVSVDVAELNPRFDIDDRTAKLAARLIFEITERL